MIISFAWTTPALLAGAKTMTRRGWKPEHAARFGADMLIDAWDHAPRVRSAQRVGTIRTTRDVYLQRSSETGDVDYAREGFTYMLVAGTAPDRARVAGIWESWHMFPVPLYVVEFELVPGHDDHRHGPRGECVR